MLKKMFFSTIAVLVVAALLTSGAQAAVTMDMVYVGNPGNLGDGCGMRLCRDFVIRQHMSLLEGCLAPRSAGAATLSARGSSHYSP